MPEKYLFLSGGGWALGGANYVGSVSIIQQTLLTTNLGDMDIDIEYRCYYAVLYCNALYCTVLCLPGLHGHAGVEKVLQRGLPQAAHHRVRGRGGAAQAHRDRPGEYNSVIKYFQYFLFLQRI